MNEEAHISIPLDERAIARLVYERGAGHVRLDGDAEPLHLLDASFDGVTPQVVMADATITVRQPRRGWRRRHRSELSLSPRVGWAIEVHGGVADLTAILDNVRVRSVHVDGGASDLALVLRRPVGTVPVHIDGGAARLFVRRPYEVAMRVTVHGGASDLQLDDLEPVAGSGALAWQTAGFDRATNRYDLTVGGGAAGIVLATDPPLSTRHPGLVAAHA
jgi:hypothetical protein